MTEAKFLCAHSNKKENKSYLLGLGNVKKLWIMNHKKKKTKKTKQKKLKSHFKYKVNKAKPSASKSLKIHRLIGTRFVESK